ncbi:hypothetical protein [Burkholderia ubonensis]|uniref:hypothetical protein n=1 Tax=Burkholderia ubonensis TaxID=101571 RepID=UPI0010542CAE|nr:hypothetical protein [Burkholderia ubonensis]
MTHHAFASRNASRIPDSPGVPSGHAIPLQPRASDKPDGLSAFDNHDPVEGRFLFPRFTPPPIFRLALSFGRWLRCGRFPDGTCSRRLLFHADRRRPAARGLNNHTGNDVNAELYERDLDTDEPNSAEWSPPPQKGRGWRRLEIDGAEKGPGTLVERDMPREPFRRRRERKAAAAVAFRAPALAVEAALMSPRFMGSGCGAPPDAALQ